MYSDDHSLTVLLSQSVFPATCDEAIDGYIAIRGRYIESVGPRSEADKYIEGCDRLIELGGRTVMPGLVDVHTFFTGWALRRSGCDCSTVSSTAEGIQILTEYRSSVSGELLLGHGLDPEVLHLLSEVELSEAFPHQSVVVFTGDGGTCWMNEHAREMYGFTPEECYAEKVWRIMPELLGDPAVQNSYSEYMALLNSKGVTAIKEMAFDDYYGFSNAMETMEGNGQLTVRVHMMSQPVGRGLDLDYARGARDRFSGPFLQFSGFNRMTDRGIPYGLGELIDPYKSDPTMRIAVPVEWDLIETEVRAIDAEGFRYSLHCQGDGAVRHTVALFDSCQKREDGTLLNRHAITDLEYSNKADLRRFGVIGGVCEIYPQIQSLDAKQDVVEMVDRQLGLERIADYWNRRTMWDSDVHVCCGTDLPLLFPDLGESIHCAVGGLFADGESLNEQNMLTTPELLRSWTEGGAYDCFRENEIGTLEAGKLADIAVFDCDLLAVDPREARSVATYMTISDGRIVYSAKRKES